MKQLWFSVLALLLVLTACQPVLSVRLDSGDQELPAPRFVVEEPGEPAAEPKFHTIKVYGANDRLLWHARAENFGSTSGGRSIVYGKAPDGFRDVKPAEPLEPGQSYNLRVSGIAQGALAFQADGQGRVR